MRIKQFLQVAVLVMLAGGVAPAYSALWQWSKTASSNAGADPTINWAEGMSPSSINDSARAQMARSAEWRDDISGSLTTGGTSTAYTLSTNELAGGNGIGTTPNDGQMLAFRASATNGAAATMAVDGGTAFALQSPAGTVLPAGTLISGTPYRMQFNNANSAWVIEGLTGNPYSVPLGGMLPSTVATAPNSNFILPAGQCISTTTYAAYWVALGSPASGACGGGLFAVIDLRGRVPVPLDNLNGTLANRMTTAGCGAALTAIGTACTATETFQIVTANLPSYTPAGTITNGQITVTMTGSTMVAGTCCTNNTGGITTGGGIISVTQLPSTFAGTNNGGLSTAIPRVMPSIGVSYFLRVI